MCIKSAYPTAYAHAGLNKRFRENLTHFSAGVGVIIKLSSMSERSRFNVEGNADSSSIVVVKTSRSGTFSFAHRDRGHGTSVTSKKSPNVNKSCPKMIPLEKRRILTPSQKLPKVGNLGKIIVATGFVKLPIAINRPIWSHCMGPYLE